MTPTFHPRARTGIGGVTATLMFLAATVFSAQAQQPPASGQAPSGAETQEQRIQQLEEQMLDLNGIVGTLQSLVGQGQLAGQQPAGGSPMVAPQPGVANGDIGQRVDVIETQIRALTGQIEQIAGQLAAIQAALGGGEQPEQPGQLQLQAVTPDAQPQTPQPPALAQPQSPTFGTVTIQPEQPQDQSAQPQTAPAATQQHQQAALPQSPGSRAAYDTAYNFLLQRDFRSAEAGFRDFVETYPNDPLAGNAQYWLGETYYVRGAFREAADAFLAGYRKYGNSDKAPANLLKLGMSLHQLGEKDAACATFSELTSKFPNAPAHLKQRAASERQRAGC